MSFCPSTDSSILEKQYKACHSFLNFFFRREKDLNSFFFKQDNERDHN